MWRNNKVLCVIRESCILFSSQTLGTAIIRSRSLMRVICVFHYASVGYNWVAFSLVKLANTAVGYLKKSAFNNSLPSGDLSARGNNRAFIIAYLAPCYGYKLACFNWCRINSSFRGVYSELSMNRCGIGLISCADLRILILGLSRTQIRVKRINRSKSTSSRALILGEL